MRVLIISDTHRRNENLFKILDRIEKPDMIVHCGDVEGSEYTISECARCPVEMVAGFFQRFASGKRVLCGGLPGVADSWTYVLCFDGK